MKNKEDQYKVTFIVSENVKTPESEFVEQVLFTFCEEAISKYDKGYIEHGGSITDRCCLKEAQQEVKDQMFYLAALEKKLIDKITTLNDIHYSLSLVECLNENANRELEYQRNKLGSAIQALKTL
jgi:hypothetical protein